MSRITMQGGDTPKGASRTLKAGAPQDPERRGFLKSLGLGTAAAASAIVPATVTPAQAYDPGPSETKARYRESDHVKAFYRTNRY